MSVILSSTRIQNGDIMVPAKPGPPGKNEREREREREREVLCYVVVMTRI